MELQNSGVTNILLPRSIAYKAELAYYRVSRAVTSGKLSVTDILKRKPEVTDEDIDETIREYNRRTTDLNYMIALLGGGSVVSIVYLFVSYC